jgi:acyl-CoA thioesterase-1
MNLLGNVYAEVSAPVLMVFGDSLSAGYGLAKNEGWVTLLSQRLSTYPYQVVNESISGETTSGGLARLPQALQTHHPRIVILELGANDGLRALSLQEMRDNLTKLITLSQQAGAKVLLLGMKIPPNYGKVYTEGFHQTFVQLATEFPSLSFVPFFLEGVAGKAPLMQDDRLHPAANAQAQLLETVWEKLSGLLEKTSVTTGVK